MLALLPAYMHFSLDLTKNTFRAVLTIAVVGEGIMLDLDVMIVEESVSLHVGFAPPGEIVVLEAVSD